MKHFQYNTRMHDTQIHRGNISLPLIVFKILQFPALYCCEFPFFSTNFLSVWGGRLGKQ